MYTRQLLETGPSRDSLFFCLTLTFTTLLSPILYGLYFPTHKLPFRLLSVFQSHSKHWEASHPDDQILKQRRQPYPERCTEEALIPAELASFDQAPDGAGKLRFYV